MKPIKKILLFFLLCTSHTVFSQIGNTLIQSLDVDRQNGIVTVFYDLAPNEPNSFFDTEISVIINMKKVKVNTVSGDVGKRVKAGTGKKIIWNAKNDIGTMLEDDFVKVDVIARKNVAISKGKNNNNLYIGIGGTLVGGGLFALGMSNESESKNSNKILETFPNATDPYYDKVLGKTMEEVTDEVDKKHNSAVILKAAGATVAAAGIFFLIKHFVNNKKEQNVMVEPVLLSNPSFALDQKGYNPAYGAKVTVRF